MSRCSWIGYNGECVLSPLISSYCLLLHKQNQLCCHYFTCRRTQLFSHHNFSSAHFSTALSPPRHVCRSRLRDSNTESYNTHTFTDPEGEETDADNDDFDVGMEVLEDYIDSIWIFKVFRSYGWMSPVILISLLLATGPKAFLIAIALPIFQSTFTFAFQRMQGKGKTRPELNTKKIFNAKKRTSSHSYRSRNVEPKEESIQGDKYGSWVSETDESVHRSEGSREDFGGWDELDAEPSRRRARKSSGFRGSSGKKSKLRSGWGANDTTPLLLRLLVSVFPFLEFFE